MNDLIPRKPKRKRQPTAEMMREQLRLAADEIIRLRTEHEWFEKHTAAVVWNFPFPQRLTELQKRAKDSLLIRDARAAMSRSETPATRPWWRCIFRKPA